MPTNVSHPGYVSGRYYTNNPYAGGIQASSACCTPGHLVYSPIQVFDSITLSSLSMNVRSSAPGASIQFGIYDNLSGLPNNLLFDSGSIDATVAEYKEVACSISLNAGWYWLASTANGTAVSMTCAQTIYGTYPFVGCQFKTGSSPAGFVYSSSTWGALPSVAPQDSPPSSIYNFHAVGWLKVA